MKNAIFITLLILLSLNSFGQQSGSQTDSSGNAIDPLDNYIDPATQLDYKSELGKLNPDQVDVLFERCMMFTIQSEMGQSGEDSMSDSDIEAYEELVASRCKCIQDGGTWQKDSETKGQCLEETPAEKDLLLYTIDMCVDRMQLSDENCKNNMTDSCVNDFRYQCYQYITQPQEFSEKSNPILNKCDFDDQTKNIKMECRSYCYIRQTCEVKDDELKNWQIGNVYLLQKKSRSSCVKGSTYGIDSNNKIWVNNSCHGEFAIQYKDPKCGYRPTCTPKPHAIDHIPEGGNQTFEMTCDGKRAEQEGGKFFCKATPMKLDEKGKVSNVPDEQKEVTYVNDVSLVTKIGAAKCNPGGNGSAIDYSPRNKGLDGGWGIEVQNKCHATFKVSVKWKRKLCTLAGQKGSKDTCCNGLYFDPSTKICNVPGYEPTPLEDEAAIALDYSQNKCAPTIPDNAQQIVDKYFVELGHYENMFSLIDGKSDGVSSVLYPADYDKESSTFQSYKSTMEDEIKAATDKANAAKKVAMDIKDDNKRLDEFKAIAAVLEEEVEAARKKEEDSRKNLESEMAKNSDGAPKKSTYDSVKLVHDAIVRFRTDWSKETIMFNTAEDFLNSQKQEYADYLDKVDKEEATEEDKENIKFNQFNGLDIQAVAHKSQMIGKSIQIAYLQSINLHLAQYKADLQNAAQVGQNLAWYCAHNENCSEYNWLIRDKSKEEIVDFLHDAPHPYKLVQARGKMLPKITKVNKLLVDSKVYTNFESGTGQQKGLKNQEVMKNFYSYQKQDYTELPVLEVEGDSSASKDADRVLNLFRQYTQEFPLREDSLFKDNKILANYLETSKENTSGLPQFCSEQGNFTVRVPMGKAIEPLRMVQMVGLIKRFYEVYNEAYAANEECLIGLDANNDNSLNNPDTNLRLTNLGNGGATTGLSDVEGRNFVNGFTSALADHMSNDFDTSSGGSFLDNLKNRKPGLKNLTSDAESKLSAVEDKKRAKVSKLIKNRSKRKGDKDIDSYLKSLDGSIGATLGKKERLFASLSPNGNGLSGLAVGNGKNSAIGDSDRNSKKGLDSNKNFYGSRYGSGTKKNSRKSSRKNYGLSGGASSGGGSGSSSNNEILSNIDDKKYEANDSDSIFDKVTKRYIKTAYPILLEKKSTEKEETQP